MSQPAKSIFPDAMREAALARLTDQFGIWDVFGVGDEQYNWQDREAVIDAVLAALEPFFEEQAHLATAFTKLAGLPGVEDRVRLVEREWRRL